VAPSHLSTTRSPENALLDGALRGTFGAIRGAKRERRANEIAGKATGPRSCLGPVGDQRTEIYFRIASASVALSLAVFASPALHAASASFTS
jgi:hypothetical protein